MRPLLLALAVVLMQAGAVHAQSLKVLTTGAFKQVVMGLVPPFESRTGARVEVVADTAGGLLKRIEGGEAFDLVFLTPAGLQTLARAGRVDPASVRPVAQVAIGVAVKTGAPVPPLETVEQFQDAVRRAHKVAYIDPASGGSSGIYLDGLFQRLGMAEAVRAKAVLVPGGYAAERVANGEADLAIHQVSEILPVPGVVLAGLLPASIQNFTTYGLAIAQGTPRAAAAAAFAAAVATPEAQALIRAKGMQALP